MPRATDVDYPIDGSPSASGYSADQADAALNRRRRRHQRIITALTSLRFGCFLGMVAAAALCVICGSWSAFTDGPVAWVMVGRLDAVGWPR